MNLPEFQLERFFAEHEFSAEHLLCSSDCQSMALAELLDFETDARDRFDELWLGYTESQGCPQLRAAVAGIYESMGLDNILVFAGAEEAIYLFMLGLLTKDDHAIVHWPCYQSLETVTASFAGSVDRWAAEEQNGWRLDLDQLVSLIQPATRLIVINTPHNPTGWLMPQHDWRELHRIAAERDILVFCDEVYRESEYNTADRLPAGCDMGDHAISLGVMSKTYGLAGLRIGWVATKNESVLRKLAQLKDYTTICNSAPSEFLAELALRYRQRLVDRNLGIIRANLVLIDSFMESHRDFVSWHRPSAGAIGFPKLLTTSVGEFCGELLSQTGVLLAPGDNFGYPGEHFRLGFGRADMPVGLEKLSDHIAANGNR